uniref:Uncharacterized protein n=1 Tax=Buteo japonicus TaxID=224669 RepID=A0A8B9Z412_9AVES
IPCSFQHKYYCVAVLLPAGIELIFVLVAGIVSESAFIMQKLMDRPCPEQFCDQYKPEWPKMKELLAKAAEPKSCLQRISECMRAAFPFRSFYGPEEDGVLDHMVKVTTSLGSPFIALSCRTVCPGSPPSVGKRRLAVQEILRKQRAEEIRSQDKDHFSSYEKLFQNSKVTLIPKKKDRRKVFSGGGLNKFTCLLLMGSFKRCSPFAVSFFSSSR